MKRELTDGQHRLLETYGDAVLARYRTGEWDLQKARTHLVEAFTLDIDSDEFHRHAMFAIGRDGDA
jgi:hypothetical protein